MSVNNNWELPILYIGDFDSNERTQMCPYQNWILSAQWCPLVDITPFSSNLMVLSPCLLLERKNNRIDFISSCSDFNHILNNNNNHIFEHHTDRHKSCKTSQCCVCNDTKNSRERHTQWLYNLMKRSLTSLTKTNMAHSKSVRISRDWYLAIIHKHETT